MTRKNSKITVKKLNIGCGTFPKKGYWNTDKVKSPGVDQILDLEKKLPYKDNTFEKVYASHIIEHIVNFEQLINEIHRVCKPNAIIEIIVPHFSSSAAFYFDHKVFFDSTGFKHFTNFIETVKRGGMGKTKGLFELLKNQIVFARGFNPLNYFGWLINMNNSTRQLYENTFLRSLMPAKEIHFILKVKKSKK